MSAMAIADDRGAHAPQGSLATLALGALGVVYGDIGTSPLYTLKTALEWARRRNAGSRDRHAVADRLDASDHHLDQIRRRRHARRQRRRGRHPGADVAARHQAWRTAPWCHRHRCARRGAALRRRRHHAGDLGVERARGPEDCRLPEIAPYIVPLSVAGAGRLVRAATAGQRPHRKTVRPDHDVLWFVTIGVLGIPA